MTTKTPKNQSQEAIKSGKKALNETSILMSADTQTSDEEILKEAIENGIRSFIQGENKKCELKDNNASRPDGFIVKECFPCNSCQSVLKNRLTYYLKKISALTREACEKNFVKQIVDGSSDFERGQKAERERILEWARKNYKLDPQGFY